MKAITAGFVVAAISYAFTPPAKADELNVNIKAGIAAVAYDALCHEPMGITVDAYVKKAMRATGASRNMVMEAIIRGGFNRASDIILTNRYEQFCARGGKITIARAS